MTLADARVALSAGLLVAIAGIVTLSIDLSAVARLAPLAVGVPTLALLAIELSRDLMRRRREAGERRQGAEPPRESGETATGILRWVAGLVGLAYLLGMVAGLSLFLGLYLRRRSGEDWRMAAASSVVLAVLLQGLVEVLLRVPLYRGALWLWQW